jgi:YesN/AraC family two-component response regulator
MGEETVKKILVIEDEASMRTFFLRGLKAKGFYTIGAENGQVGVQQAREQLPDLIICDILMPKLDGYRVLTALRRDPATAIIPFIFVSAKEDRTDLRKGMELGADDYLTKPCTLEELVRAITIQLEKQTVLRQWYAAQSQPVPELPSADTATVAAVPESISASNPKLSEVFRFIEANYHQPIALGDVAQAVGYSPAYLTNLMRRQTGQTVQRWIIDYRMKAALSLLLETDQGVEQIAVKVGYNNAVHFFRQFRQLHGTTPQAWRSAHRSRSA